MPNELVPTSQNETAVAVFNSPVEDVENAKISTMSIQLLGSTILISSFIIGYLMYALWPIPTKALPGTDNEISQWVEESIVFGMQMNVSSEQRLLILVLLAGAMGSFIHAATSFSNYVGEGKIDKKWIWWYILRPVIGMAVALTFYLIFRAGLFAGMQIELLNIYGVLTLAALSGLFTDRATLKLEEIFQSLFKPKDERKGKLTDQNKNEFDNPDAHA